MKYLAGIFITLALVGPFILKPWPHMQLVFLPVIALIWAYSFVVQKIFRINIKTESSGREFIFGFIYTFLVGTPFAFGVFPWLKGCAIEQQMIAPVPLTSICIILIAIPAYTYGIKVVNLKTKNKTGRTSQLRLS